MVMVEWKQKLTDIKPKMDGKQLKEYLQGFTGNADVLYGHWSKQITYTEGVYYLAMNAGAFWLIDAIASHQQKALKDPMLKAIQFWTLECVNIKTCSGDLCCYRDTRDLAFAQRVEYTDFPFFEGFKLIVEGGKIMLPRER